MSSRSRRWARRIVTGLSAVLAGTLAAIFLYGTSVQPGAAIVKAAFEVKPEVTPPAGFAAIRARVREAQAVALTSRDVPTAHLQLYSPAQPTSAALPMVLWVHGGGFISSSADTVRDYAIMLADRGYIVANLDYSLAPGSKHPVPVVQANEGLAYLRSHAAALGGDPSAIVVGGDSAGAQIASELAAVQTNPSLAGRMHLAPALAPGELHGVVLLCGLYDMRTVADTGFPALRTYLWAYTGVRNWTDYAAIDDLSTTSTATADYPPTFLTVGDADPFRTQADELNAALARNGVDVTYLDWAGSKAGLGHEYQFDFARPQARTAFTETVAFLDRRTGVDR